MIQVILLILKIIGIVLAVLLLTVLLLLALVLFVPIRYRVRVMHNPEQTSISGRASFLFPVLVFRFRYAEKLFSYKGRVFGFVFTESGKEKKKKEPKKKKGKQKEGKKEEESKEEKQGKVPDKSLEGEVPQKEGGGAGSTETGEGKQEKPLGFFAKIRLRFEKIRNTISNIRKKLARLLRQKDEVLRILKKPETKEAIRFAWDKLKKTVLHIIPKKIKGQLIYGGRDPAATGQMLGIVGVVYAMTGPLVKIIPDFENERLECDLEFRGGLQVFTILVIAIKLYLNQELKQLIQEIKNIKEIE